LGWQVDVAACNCLDSRGHRWSRSVHLVGRQRHQFVDVVLCHRGMRIVTARGRRVVREGRQSSRWEWAEASL